MDGSCETLLSWLTTPVAQSEGVSPGRTVPVVVCCPLRCNSHAGIIFQENPNNHCVSYLGFSTFNYDFIWKTEMPQTIICENKSVLPSWSFWATCPLASFTQLF